MFGFDMPKQCCRGQLVSVRHYDGKCLFSSSMSQNAKLKLRRFSIVFLISTAGISWNGPAGRCDGKSEHGNRQYIFRDASKMDPLGEVKRKECLERQVDCTFVDRRNVPVGVGQKTRDVVIKDSVRPPSEVDAVAQPADIGSAQVTGDAESQRLSGGGGLQKEKKAFEDVESGPGPGDTDHATVVDAVRVAALNDAGGNILVRFKKMMENTKSENVSVHTALVAERAAHARPLMNSTCLQRDMKKVAGVIEKKSLWCCRLREDQSAKQDGA